VRELPDPAATIKLLLPILADGMKSAHASRRRDAAEALVRLAARDDADVIPPLLVALKSTDIAVREAAIDGLGWVADRDARTIAGALAPLLQTRDRELRLSTILAISHCHAAALPHYIGLLRHADVQARLRACTELAILAENHALGDNTSDAVQALAALARTAECRRTAIETIRAIAPESAFAPLLEALEGDQVVGATLRRAGKGGREPGKLLAVLVRELRDASPRVGCDAAEALAQLEMITWQLHERFYLTGTVGSLEATAALAAQRLGADDARARRDAIGQLVALRSLVQEMWGRLDKMTPLEPGVTYEMRDTELAKLNQAIDDCLQRAAYHRDREVRRLARRATRVIPWPWPPEYRRGLPRLPVRLHPHTTSREAAA
jgi:HEAT repeat protein